jgi:cysteine desulfurase
LGCGALIMRDGFALDALIDGGTQESRRRAGTENVPAIVGFVAALQEKPQNIKALRDQLEVELEGALVIGKDIERLPNTTCFARPGLLAETALIAFDLEGIAVSSGSACSSGKVAKSHVLAAMGLAPEIAASAIRVSLGWNTTQADIEQFGAAWRRILSRQQSKAAA